MCTIQLWLGNLRRKADINVDFFSSGGGVVNFANRFDLQLQPEDWDPNVAGDDEPHTAFEIGLRHMNEGSYVAATQSFWQCINSESGSSEAVTSVKCIFDFARAVDRDLNQLRDSFLDIAIENEDENPNLAWKARKYAFYCTRASGRYADAVTEAQELQEFAPEEIERLFLEIDILAMGELMDDNLDAVGNNEIEIVRLHEEIEKIVSGQTKHEVTTTPEKFSLQPVYPNPFNSVAKIRYEVANPAHFVLKVFDTSGREIITLLDNKLDAGYYETAWNGNVVPTGIYFLRMNTDGFVQTQKLALVK
jgi:hypothetical protein